MKTKFPLLLFLLFPFFSFCQLKQGEINISNFEGYAVIQSNDEGYAVAGSVNGGNSFAIDKLDKDGNLTWSKIIGSGNYNEAFSLVQTKDGGYAMAGYTSVYGAGGEDVYVVKLDANGNLKWTKTIGGPDDDWGNAIVQTKDGGYAITGGTKSYGGGVPSSADIYVIKLDSDGNKLWTKTIEGPWGSDDEGNSIIQTKDGGIVVTGNTLDLSGWDDAFVFKLDSTGNLLWTNTLGGAHDNQDSYSVVQTVDGGFAITGSNYSNVKNNFYVYVVKLDSIGTLVWAETIGGNRGEGGNSIVQTKDKGYAIAAITNSFGKDSIDEYIIKLDSIGNLKWTKVFGEPEYNYVYSLIQTNDGGFATIEEGPYFVKLDSLGNSCLPEDSGGIVGIGGSNTTTGGIITSSDSGRMGSGGTIINGANLTTICKVTSIEELNKEVETIEAYPNPSNGKFIIQIVNENWLIESYGIEIYNIMGEKIYSQFTTHNSQFTIQLNDQPNGIYFIRLMGVDKEITGKIILQK
jgi:hypothetical protein